MDDAHYNTLMLAMTRHIVQEKLAKSDIVIQAKATSTGAQRKITVGFEMKELNADKGAKDLKTAYLDALSYAKEEFPPLCEGEEQPTPEITYLQHNRQKPIVFYTGRLAHLMVMNP
ncbi:MAG: hypothetical protein H6868_08475 [Rhodospirillales bacterium]|nr:hypothetical protein [Rhodospirillales bacterium]